MAISDVTLGRLVLYGTVTTLFGLANLANRTEPFIHNSDNFRLPEIAEKELEEYKRAKYKNRSNKQDWVKSFRYNGAKSLETTSGCK